MLDGIKQNLRLISPPAVEPMTLAEARAQLRLTATGSPATHPDDSLLTAYIKAAREWLDGKDGELGRQLVTATWELVLDTFPANEIRIPLPPLQSIVSIKYDDPAQVEQTISVANYVVDTASQPGWILPVDGYSWPETLDSINTVRVRFKAGYGDAASDVPAPLIVAVKLLMSHMYQHRTPIIVGTSAQSLPIDLESFIARYRVDLL